ncbi:MAG: DUF2063 domain-containing protein [Cycloclasticus sp. symbiont of Poecilosclerida sp. M]|nr:MAG: DUF2063 domain-containing protein [Cycloclasticus sp. symbiont of Poecilosclerida sp. M]
MRTQHKFTQYIRNPQSAPAPDDIEERRMNMYRDLLFANLSNMLGDNFPVLKKILCEESWIELIRDFFSRHHSNSPYFSEMSQEFIAFCQSERCDSPESKNDFPFLVELAHYEWTELVTAIAEDDDISQVAIADPLNQTLTLASTAMPLGYTYPVHKISPDFLPTEEPEQPTFLVVYRDTKDQVGFLETNPTSHQLLLLFTENTGNKAIKTINLLKDIAKQMNHPNPDTVIQGGLEIIKDFIKRGILVHRVN